MNRKPMLVKIRERVLSTLPLLPDADLAHIGAVCNTLMQMRAQVKRDALSPPVRKTVGEAARDAIETGNGYVEIPRLPYGQAQTPSEGVTDAKQD